MPLDRRMISTPIVLALTATLHAAPHYELDSTPETPFATPRIQAHVIFSDQSLTLIEIVLSDAMPGPWPDERGIGLVAVGARGRVEVSVDVVEASRAGRPAQVLTAGSSHVPYDLVHVSDPAVWRELRVVRVGIRPAWRLGPDEWVATRMVVRVANAGGQGEAELDHPARPISPHWDRLYRAHVLNYEAFQPPRLAVGTGPRYVVVSRSRFAAETPQFVEWKTRQGYGVDLVTLEDLGYTNPLDRDAINATKRHIMEAYTSWDEPVEFVLLTGDMYDAIPEGS
ncbi:MAG: C25 family cysteine peptidase, partial [Candidatus Eisenbacteria bacterium]|nr:C25 family cysteine peptidase [Candidatus Eisenbacteria bacterium]